jgi:hypothetical protein
MDHDFRRKQPMIRSVQLLVATLIVSAAMPMPAAAQVVDRGAAGSGGTVSKVDGHLRGHPKTKAMVAMRAKAAAKVTASEQTVPRVVPMPKVTAAKKATRERHR